MDVHALWRLSVAGLRYQYVRDLGSARFAAVEHQLLDTGPEARELWDGYTSAFPRRRSDCGTPPVASSNSAS